MTDSPVIIVSGESRGLGVATARWLASSGAATLTVEHVSAYCAAKAALNHFTRVLAAEEPRLTVMAVRPGVVDTRMQKLIRRDGLEVMTAEQAAYYQNLKVRGELEAPEVPGRAIAYN